jgi:uncharacterized protein (TIGR02246 family)
VDSEIAAIKRVLENYALSVNAGDFESWISLWIDDGTAMPPDSPACVGKEQFRRDIKPEFDALDMEMVILSIDDTKVYGDFGLTRCRYTLKVTPKTGGEPISAMPEGKALTLYERHADGSWKIAYDCYNSSVPANEE